MVAERLRSAVERRGFEFSGTRIPVTISVGITAIPDPAITDAAAFLAGADKAMYEAKSGGRNRVCVRTAEELTPTPQRR